MASSGNFATWNSTAPNKSDIAFSSGNCRVTSGSGAFRALSTFVLPTNSGKWYVEVCSTANSGNTSYVGVVSEESPDLNADGTSFNFGRSSGDKTVYFDITVGNIITENSNSQTGLSTFSSNNDIIGMVLDMDNDNVQFYGNGSALGTAQAFPDASQNYYIWCGGNNDKVMHINAGQDSTFAGAVSAGGNADGNGHGDFKYTVPTNAKAICSANLPVSSNIDPAETDDNIPTKQFGVVTFTGNGTARTISGLGFQPDFIFAKKRSNGKRGYTVDSSRGFNKYLHPDGLFSEGDDSTGITSATSDGFAIGGSLDYINENTHTYVAWCWRANGGTTATNTSGTITTTVQANQAAGFSILTYAGANGSWGSTHQDTLGHGLSAAPEFMIFKERNATDASTVFHHSVGAGGGTTAAHNNLRIDNHDALYTNQSYKSFGGVMPTSTVITIEGNTTNLSTSTHVAYVWHGVEGYSKFGAYEGNGGTDGAFVFCGFRPRMVFVKQIDGGAEWACYDSERDAFNEMGNCLEWDLEAAEKTHASDLTTDAMMFFSNGFKLTGGGGGRTNQSGRTFVYGAWADVPFKYNNAKE